MILKITKINMTVVTLPFDKSFKGSAYDISGQSAVIPTITTDDGLQSEIYEGDEPSARTNPQYYEKVLRFIVDSFKDLLLGEDPFNVTKIWEEMVSRVNAFSYGPTLENVRIDKKYMMQAIGAIDTALWDLIGKSLHEPVYKLLGAYKEKIPVGGILYYKGGNEIEETASAVKALKNNGFGGVHLKVGGMKIEQDAEKVKAAREAGGHQFKIDCDANKAWKVKDAIRFAKSIEDYDVAWLEEPVQAYDMKRNLKIVKNATTIPVCAGQDMHSIYECRELIDSDAVDYLNPSPFFIGGVTPWMRLAHTAYAYDVSLYAYMSGAMSACSGLQLMASIPNGLYLISGLDRDLLRDRLWKNAPKPRDGFIEVSQEPGFGVHLNHSTIQELKTT